MSFVNEIKRQNDRGRFLNYFAKNHGYPLWEKASILKTNEGIVAIIPFALDNVREVNGFIVAKKDLLNRFSFGMYRKDLLALYGYHEALWGLNASDVQTIINYFNLASFSINSYKLLDSRQLPLEIRQQYPDRIDKKHLMGRYKFRSQNIRVFSMECLTYQEETEWWWNPDGDACNCNGDEYYVYSAYNNVTICWDTDEVQVPVGGGGGSIIDWWTVGGNGGTTATFVINNLQITDPSTQDWLVAHPDLATELVVYFSASSQTLDATKQLALDHIHKTMTDAGYLNFVNNHRATTTSSNVWWEDQMWLSDPDNFNLDIDPIGTQYDELTAQEKILVAAYPIAAYKIRQNIAPALQEANARYPGTVLNGKGDAFRHAYFNAMNTRDVFPSLYPPPAVSGSDIVRAFATAHESEVPAVLQLEKTMDLFNNDVGISYCWNCFTTSNATIAAAIVQKLDSGELRYLTPLDFNASPEYDVNPRDHIQDCPTCLNGMTSITQIKPTNQ